MRPNNSATSPKVHLEREVEREKDERHKNDEARWGMDEGEDARVKDARDSNNSAGLPRRRGR